MHVNMVGHPLWFYSWPNSGWLQSKSRIRDTQWNTVNDGVALGKHLHWYCGFPGWSMWPEAVQENSLANADLCLLKALNHHNQTWILFCCWLSNGWMGSAFQIKMEIYPCTGPWCVEHQHQCSTWWWTVFPNSLQIPDQHGQLPFQLALDFEAPSQVLQLMVQTFLDAMHILDQQGKLPLHSALDQMSLDVLDLLVKSYPESVHMKNRLGYLPLKIWCYTMSFWWSTIWYNQWFAIKVIVGILAQIHSSTWWAWHFAITWGLTM